MSADDTSVLPATMAPRAPAPRIPLYVASGVAVLALGAAAWFHVQSAELEQALAAANDRAQAAEQATSRARNELKASQALVAERDAELAKLRETPIPVDVTFRAGRPGTGFIAQLDNRGADPLDVEVVVERASTGERATLQVEIPARGLGEIGAGNGWAFESGDTLRVSAGRYQATTLRVP